jgi:hypothetical protein
MQKRWMGCLCQGTVCWMDSTTEKEQHDEVEFRLGNRFSSLPCEWIMTYLPVYVSVDTDTFLVAAVVSPPLTRTVCVLTKRKTGSGTRYIDLFTNIKKYIFLGSYKRGKQRWAITQTLNDKKLQISPWGWRYSILDLGPRWTRVVIFTPLLLCSQG